MILGPRPRTRQHGGKGYGRTKTCAPSEPGAETYRNFERAAPLDSAFFALGELEQIPQDPRLNRVALEVDRHDVPRPLQILDS